MLKGLVLGARTEEELYYAGVVIETFDVASSIFCLMADESACAAGDEMWLYLQRVRFRYSMLVVHYSECRKN